MATSTIQLPDPFPLPTSGGLGVEDAQADWDTWSAFLEAHGLYDRTAADRTLAFELMFGESTMLVWAYHGPRPHVVAKCPGGGDRASHPMKDPTLCLTAEVVPYAITVVAS